MRWVRQSCSLAIGLGLVAGCANVKVKKVDVDQRIAGKDNHVRGFRYYLNRPYIVVGKHISVGTQLVPVALATPKNVPQGTEGPKLVFVGMVPKPDGQYEIYDDHGELIPGLKIEQVDPVPISASQNPGVPPPATSGVTADQQRVLGRAVAARIIIAAQAKAKAASQILAPSAIDAINAEIVGDATHLATNPGDDLQKFGTSAIPVLLKNARAATNTTLGGLLPTPAARNDFQNNIVAKLEAELKTGLFPNPGGDLRTLLARAVGVVGIGEVKSLPDFGTLNPQTQGEVVNVLTTAAVESLTKVPPTTFKDVVENAVKAMIQKAQDKTLMLGGNESTRHDIELTLVPLGGFPEGLANGLANQLLGSTLINKTLADTLPAALPSNTSVAGGAAATSPTKLNTTTAPTKPAGQAPAAQDSTTPPPPDAIQVAFLPDFEEQYAIRNKNFLARTKYQ